MRRLLILFFGFNSIPMVMIYRISLFSFLFSFYLCHLVAPSISHTLLPDRTRTPCPRSDVTVSALVDYLG
jgi:hypothetical protein